MSHFFLLNWSYYVVCERSMCLWNTTIGSLWHMAVLRYGRRRAWKRFIMPQRHLLSSTRNIMVHLCAILQLYWVSSGGIGSLSTGRFRGRGKSQGKEPSYTSHWSSCRETLASIKFVYSKCKTCWVEKGLYLCWFTIYSICCISAGSRYSTYSLISYLVLSCMFCFYF